MIAKHAKWYDSGRIYHPYPALWFALLFCVGIVLGWKFIDMIDATLILGIAVSLFALSVLFYFRRPVFFSLAVFPLIASLGILHLYFNTVVFDADHLSVFDMNKVDGFQGMITETEYRDNGRHRYLMEVDSISIGNETIVASGLIQISQGKYKNKLHYGQSVFFIGAPSMPDLPANPGMFNYRRYLQLNNIYYRYYISDKNQCAVLSDNEGSFWEKKLIIPIRGYIHFLLKRFVPLPTRNVVAALILGERQDIEWETIENFRKTGVIHVLAISGLHVAFILMALLFTFKLLRFNYTFRIVAALSLLFLFVALVNFKAPVVRSSLMAFLYFVSGFGERKTKPLNILAVAAIILLIYDPRQLFLPGFQFSFVAVGGILYGYPKLRDYFPKEKKYTRLSKIIYNYVYQPFWVSAAAVLATTPLTLWYYGSLQTGALLINVFIIPLIGLFVMLCFLFLIAASAGYFAAAGLGAILHGYFTIISKTIATLAGLPFVQFQFPNPTVVILMLTIVTVVLIYNLKMKVNRIYLVITIFIITILGGGWLKTNKNKLRATFLSVGQGDASVFEFPSGDVVVFDGGDKKFSFDAGERYLLPVLRYYGIGHVKYLISSHPHSDHFGGFISLLQNIKVDTLVITSYPSPSKLYQELLSTAYIKNVPIAFKKCADRLYVGDNSRVYFLHPDELHLNGGSFSGKEVNNSSIVAKICYGRTAFLLTGDLEKEAEPVLFRFAGLLESDVLKVGHHGSVTSSSQDFLNFVQPNYGVISVGRANKYFHPSKKTINRLRQNQIKPLRTDHLGAVVFESDGQNLVPLNWRD